MKGIDTLKLFFSLVVVWIHTGVGDLGGLTLLAVPFFFAVSGFFLFGKIFNEPDVNQRKRTIVSWMRKTLRLYLLWSLIYLPYAIYGYFQDHTPFIKAIAIYCRDLVFVGEHYMSWPLWYLLGMLWSGLIIYLACQFRIPFWVLCLIAVFLCFGKRFILQDTFATYYYLIFKTSRNGIFVGFPAMVLGGLIQRILPQMKNWDAGSWQQKTALDFRFLSTHIYLSHMIWAGMLILICGLGQGVLLWSITCILSIAAGLLIRPCDRLVKFLYGRAYRT